MVKIIKEIPGTKATRVVLPKSRPQVNAQERILRFPEENVIVPRQLQSDVYKLCGITRTEWYTAKSSDLEEKIRAANQGKNIIMRFTDDKTPISAVSDRFKEMDLRGVVRRVEEVTHKEPVIRYFAHRERLQFMFPVSKVLGGLHLFLDSGEYGTYGGSGDNAIIYGFAWPNTRNIIDETSAVLLEHGRIIHLEGPEVENKISHVLTTTKQIVGKVEESKVKTFTPDELAQYLVHNKTKLRTKITSPLYKRSLEPIDISAYELSLALTHRANKTIVDSVRINAEYLAGQLILSYEAVKEKTQEWLKDEERKKLELKPQKLIY